MCTSVVHTFRELFPRLFLYLFVPCNKLSSLAQFHRAKTVCSHWNHEITFPRPQLLLFKSYSLTRSLSSLSVRVARGYFAERIVHDKSCRPMAERFTYFRGTRKFSRSNSIISHSNGIHVLRNCDFLIIVAVHAVRYTGSRLCKVGQHWPHANVVPPYTSYLIDGSYERSGYFNRLLSCAGKNSRGIFVYVLLKTELAFS